MSSTGKCFDIGVATSQSLQEFERRQMILVKKYNISCEEIDYISDEKDFINEFNVYCSENGVAGNGALMRLAPVPLFFYRFPPYAVEYSGRSGRITHGDVKAYDACRYYGALIVAALQGYTRDQLLDRKFYSKHIEWFNGRPLCSEIKQIAEGSYQKLGGYEDGIRGKGYIVNALEAALWAFWSDGNSFERGALAAVNLGDDTDTTAAIYGQLAGAYYGYKKLPRQWVKYVYAKKFMLNLSSWIAYEGQMWEPSETLPADMQSSPYPGETSNRIAVYEANLNMYTSRRGAAASMVRSPEHDETFDEEKYENPRKLRFIQPDASANHVISPSALPMNKETVKHNNMTSHFNSEPEYEEAINEARLHRPTLNTCSSTTEPCVHSVNTIHHFEKAPRDNGKYKLALRGTKSINSTDEHIPSTRIALNKRPSDQDDRLSKVLAEQHSPEKNVESFENITYSNRAGPRNPTPINHSNVNKHGDLIAPEQSCLPQDTASLSQSFVRYPKCASQRVNTSQFHVTEAPTRESRLVRPISNVSHSQVTTDKQTKDNQLSPKPAAELATPPQAKIKPRKQSRSRKTMDTGSLDLMSIYRGHNDKYNNSK
ncbi:unnamed protein product [Rotaria sp. Silwood2]|nr:unnamed protein product [Rotaria sp. Silwood2]CAF2546699.1 unnamed protein product [Rotaria sp. Silwood2]CAF2797953.1 unnamed protein product [Rotaria sp. Silwood2]CAF2927229.1 unnamed protein product [Rotaria sp. Silwood2]CAF4041453.1 unnamed protein product [Rotaria sp. Silwood2]